MAAFTLIEPQLIPASERSGKSSRTRLRRLSNSGLDRGVREQLQKARRVGIEGART